MARQDRWFVFMHLGFNSAVHLITALLNGMFLQNEYVFYRGFRFIFAKSVRGEFFMFSRFLKNIC